MPKSYITKWVNKKQVRLHRFLMENHLRRKLTRQELVHHINGDKHDNRIENLKVVTRSEHKKLHPEIGKNCRFKPKYFVEKEFLYNEYVIKLKSISQIARELKITQPTLRRIKITHGITRPKITCEICGHIAGYIKQRRCSKCYLREWYRRHKKPNHTI